MLLSELERDGARLRSALNREYYLQRAGHKTELELDKVFDDFRHLCDPETFHRVRDLPLEEPLGEKYRRFLLDFLASCGLQFTVRRYSAAIASAEASKSITWGERELSYRTVPLISAREPDLERRHELDERWRAAVEELNPLRAERHRAQLAQVADYELGDYVALWDTLRGLQLAALSTQMEALLKTTADLYRDTLRDALAEQRLTFETAWRVDLAHVLRGSDFDDDFPKEQLVPILISTLRGLGFELEDQPNIKLDLEPRPNKSPRAFCAALQIPDDVRLVLQPQGGHQDYATLLHEAGHAEHLGNVDRGLAFAYKWLGDSSVTEGYAFLLNYLVTDRLWLQRQLDFSRLESFRRFALFQKLMMLRRYAAKLLYEQELQRAEEPAPLAERYSDLLGHHVQVHYFPEEYLADVDDGFYSAQYLRAWIFEGQLRAYLRNEYDEEWFRAPRAGKFLRDLWREGQKYTADELVQFMGYSQLEPSLMLAEIREALER
jgi:hypothetical protein